MTGLVIARNWFECWAKRIWCTSPHPFALKCILILSAHIHVHLSCDLFPLNFLIKILYPFPLTVNREYWFIRKISLGCLKMHRHIEALRHPAIDCVMTTLYRWASTVGLYRWASTVGRITKPHTCFFIYFYVMMCLESDSPTKWFTNYDSPCICASGVLSAPQGDDITELLAAALA